MIFIDRNAENDLAALKSVHAERIQIIAELAARERNLINSLGNSRNLFISEFRTLAKGITLLTYGNRSIEETNHLQAEVDALLEELNNRGARLRAVRCPDFGTTQTAIDIFTSPFNEPNPPAKAA